MLAKLQTHQQLENKASSGETSHKLFTYLWDIFAEETMIGFPSYGFALNVSLAILMMTNNVLLDSIIFGNMLQKSNPFFWTLTSGAITQVTSVSDVSSSVIEELTKSVRQSEDEWVCLVVG